MSRFNTPFSIYFLSDERHLHPTPTCNYLDILNYSTVFMSKKARKTGSYRTV